MNSMSMEKREFDSLHLKLEAVISHLTWEIHSFVRLSCVLNHGTISLASNNTIFES